MSETLAVNLGERSYVIHFATDGRELVRQAAIGRLNSGRKIAVVTDENVSRVHSRWLQSVFGEAPTFVADAGESAKSLPVFGQALDFLATHKIDRGGALFAVGGGVIGDLGGFAAAAYLRGIDFYQVPTTLPPREFAAGMAEVIKSALLGEAPLLAELEREPLTVSSPQLASVIRRCCALKARIVESDERELAKEGGRALLNLGHTFGHAIENVAGYGAYLHGEAVAIGLCAAARLSQKLGFIGSSEVARVDALVEAHALPTRLETPLRSDELFGAMARDKKVRAGLPRFVILKKLGEAATCDDVSREMAEACFKEVGATG